MGPEAGPFFYWENILHKQKVLRKCKELFSPLKENSKNTNSYKSLYLANIVLGKGIFCVELSFLLIKINILILEY